jgi:hypothetical protein
MPKRTSSKQKSDSEAGSARGEENPRATKSNAVLGEDEEANLRELDARAGVAPVASVKREVTRPANAAPLLKADTKEKRLYVLACRGTPLGQEFFDEFPDRQEVLDLALDISARLMTVAACNPDLAPTQRISAIRVLASLAGKQVPDPEDEAGFKPASAPLAIPRGSKEEVADTLEKIRRLSTDTLSPVLP